MMSNDPSDVRGAVMRRWYTFLLAAAVFGGAGAARAADMATKAAPQPQQSIWQRDTLTGDWGGLRTDLHNKGIDLTITYANEVFGVLSGGLHRDASYEGLLTFTADADLQKLVGWSGGHAHVTVFQIHGTSRNVVANVGSISDPSNIDALSTTRFYQMWFEQDFFSDRVSLRLGQLAADGDFLASPTAGNLLNGTFGWADLVAGDMINGGPAYPLATPGAQLTVKATDNIKLLGAVFAGNPAGANCNNNPQRCDRYGLTFSTSGGALFMGEAQYAINQGKNAPGLPGVYKIGGWRATADFADQRYGVDAAGAEVLLSDPAATGPRNHGGDWGIYGVADQTVWRSGDRSVSLFARGGYSPPDRNLISWYADGGAGFKGLVPGRTNDVLTFGLAYANFSADAAAADRDAGNAVRDHEIVFELNYAAQIAPWWTVQPDVQYIVHPNGGQNPDDPTQGLDHAFVAGVRSTITF